MPAPLNHAFRLLLSAEAPLIRRGNLPYGLSLMALGRKPLQAAVVLDQPRPVAESALGTPEAVVAA